MAASAMSIRSVGRPTREGAAGATPFSAVIPARLGHARLFGRRAVVAGEVQVVDGHVDLGHREPRDALDTLDDVVANLLTDLRDRLAVLDHGRQVDGGLALTDLDRY